MAKYHISPSTGKPNKCTANTRPCPHGGEDEHYGSAAEARAAYEASMAGETLTSSRRLSAVPDISGSMRPSDLARIADEVQAISADGGVASLSAHRQAKEDAQADILSEARIRYDFDNAKAALKTGLYSKAELKILDDVAAGKRVSDEKLDEFLDARRHDVTDDSANQPDQIEAAKNVLGYVEVVRAQSGTPSTLPTIDTFDPSTQTLFSNPKARSNATIMGKAIRREFAHSEWMHELSAQAKKASVWAKQDGNDKLSVQELQLAANRADDATRSEARVQAQLRELQYRFDTDESFAKTVNADVRRMLVSGYFRGKASSYDGVPIGTVKTVK